MEKLWAGRAAKSTDAAADDFNSSLRVDCRMFREDIRGSMAHAAMLCARGILTPADRDAILAGLEGILADMESGALPVTDGEDIHMFVEAELTRRIGDAGKRLHTARSRNDQVAVDTRLYLRGETEKTAEAIRGTISVLLELAEAQKDAVMPGYTHLQRAQPVTFGHHMLAWASMLVRDLGRLRDAGARMNRSPLGACALAGTTYDTDPAQTAAALGFDGPVTNSLDAVSDRDFCLELAAALSIVMTHLSRMAEEVVLWASWEFRFIELDDAWTTGSSIMPQKKNADMAELIRGKTGRVYGDLMALLTVMKGLPLAYNKDMQEDKEAIFDAFDTVRACLGVLTPMLKTMTVRRDNLRRAAAQGFINATDLADYLVGKGLPFRDAYKLVGQIVAACLREGQTLETLPLEQYRQYSPLFGGELYAAIDLDTCVRRRERGGGPGPASLEAQLAALRQAAAL